ncbi:sugar ABC transporter ATP-binding protein [Oryzibacter oryziterrae]|uniref:sugar ABC transporter ATP-binding protein n=1 Tax=Oryzibacter oryziterrae TaxID=2766474 RepID=UPI001F2AE4F7|nr:sugar ABC transporter ATP-binding protein [Oryzibacter oryziterrae]
MSNVSVLALKGIYKSFGGVEALSGASLSLERGSVHGLVGQNGAGKSTLVKVLAGIHQPDGGTIEIGGHDTPHLTPHRAESLGIHFIHQDRLLAPTLTVAESLYLGAEPRWFGLPIIDRQRLRRDARDVLQRVFEIDISPDALVRDLSTAEQKIVQITRALLQNPRILVLDEPTTALVRSEAEHLFSAIDRLKAEGLSILYISHYLNEIERLCDKVTVLRNGKDVGTVSPREVPAAGIVAMMIDRKVDALFPKRTSVAGDPVLEVRGLSRDKELSDVSLTLRKGEVVGITGLVGSGTKAFARTLFGLMSPTSGEILLHGERLKPGSTVAAVARGIGLVPEDRRNHGISLDLTVRENATLASLSRFTRKLALLFAKERAAVGDFIDRLGIKTRGPEALLRNLSGGNQQKVVLSKWLIHGSDVVILDEPTVGVDVGAKVDIYREIRALADSGAAILVVSSDLLELTGISDRVAVFFRGRIVAERQASNLNQDDLLQLVTTGQTAEKIRNAAE